MVRLLICEGADLSKHNAVGDSSLHLAAQNERADIVEILLNNEADPNVANLFFKYTPLHIAVEHGDLHMAELLVSHGARIDIGDEDGYTPLDYAEREGNVKMISFLKIRPPVQTQ